MSNHLESARKKIEKLVPELKIRTVRIENGFREKTGEIDLMRDITLADVLIAIEYSGTPVAISSQGFILTFHDENGWFPSGKVWTLGKPFSDQSPEMHKFIDEILV